MKKTFKSIVGILFASLSVGAAIGIGGINHTNKNVEVAEAANWGLDWYITGSYTGGAWGTFEKFSYNSDWKRYEMVINTTTSTEFKIYNGPSTGASYCIHRGMSGDLIDYNNKGWLKYTQHSSYDNFKINYAGEYVISYTADVATDDHPAWFFRIEPTSYIYYVTESSSETVDYIYAWGDFEEYGTWPGKAIKDVGTDVTGVMQFQGNNHKIYKIPLSVASFKYHNNAGKESSNKTMTSGGAYWWDDTIANTNAGTALDLLVDEEKARNAVTASGTIKKYSICGIDPTKAAKLWNRYYAFSAKATYIDSSKTYTYVDETGTTEGLVSFYDIFLRLKLIAQGGGQTVSGAIRMPLLPSVSDSSTTVVIVISALVLTTAVGGFFFFRKKRA